MQSVPLFTQKKEIFLAFLVVLVIAFSSLAYEYVNYQKFIKEPLHVSHAVVLNHYQKTNDKGRVYDVLKLKLPSGVSFYTVSWKPLHVKANETVKVKFKVEKLRFIEYLRGFYANSLFVYSVYQDTLPLALKIALWIESQHSEPEMSSLFQALFLATPLTKSMRDAVQHWGIAHLVAISGFHLGVLSALLFGLINPLYRFFQDRYFPYRNRVADVSLIVFALLYMYMALIGFTPSFMRAFVMSVVAFYLFSRGVKIISFTNLLISTLILLALFPSLVFSVSFWFSVSGVFYIFLFLHHFSHWDKWKIFIMLNVWVYLLMIPIVHFIFPSISFLQASSPLLSMLFVVFYPLSMFLHVIGLGGLLDGLVLELLHVKVQSYTAQIPLAFVIGYVGLSLLAIRFRFLCLVLVCASLSVFYFIE